MPAVSAFFPGFRPLLEGAALVWVSAVTSGASGASGASRGSSGVGGSTSTGLTMVLGRPLFLTSTTAGEFGLELEARSARGVKGLQRSWVQGSGQTPLMKNNNKYVDISLHYGQHREA